MPYINTPQGDIYYYEQGQGEPILFLAGLGATTESWPHLFKFLAKTHRCICVDNRGMGKSYKAQKRFSMSDLAADAKVVIDTLGIKKVHVLGNSLGGIIAQAYAYQYPENVNSLILLSSTPGFVSLPVSWHSIKLFLWAGLDNRKFIPKQWRKQSHQTFDEVSKTEEFAMPSTVTPPIPVFDSIAKKQIFAAARWYGIGKLPKINAPTLVIHGLKDNVIPSFNARICKRLLPDAQLKLIEDTGHFILTDAAKEVCLTIDTFYKSLSTHQAPVAISGTKINLLGNLTLQGRNLLDVVLNPIVGEVKHILGHNQAESKRVI